MATPEARTTGQVVRDTTRNLQTLAKAEVDLAKAELQAELRTAIVGVGLLLAVTFIGLYVLGFIGVTVAKALEQSFEPWLAWLIVTLGQIVVAGILAAVGASRLRKADLGLSRTNASIQETLAWAKQLTRP